MTTVHTPPDGEVFLFDDEGGEEEVESVGLFEEAALLCFEVGRLPIVKWPGQRGTE